MLVTVNTWPGLVVFTITSPKFKLVGVTRKPCTPVPTKLIGTFTPLIVMPSPELTCGPSAVGVNVYVLEQLVPAASVTPLQPVPEPQGALTPLPTLSGPIGAEVVLVTVTC
jgi:hypothetical protein